MNREVITEYDLNKTKLQLPNTVLETIHFHFPKQNNYYLSDVERLPDVAPALALRGRLDGGSGFYYF